MTQKYLCATHRQQLRNNPKQALRAWSKSYENGQSLLSMGFPLEALAHIGCSYEAAEIVLSAEIIDTFDAVTLVTSSAATLARLLDELGQSYESKNIIELTSQRIEKECAKSPELTALLQNQLQSLRYFVEDTENYEYPLEEAKLSIHSFMSIRQPTSVH